MTTLVEKLTQTAEKFASIACFGMDPVLAKIPPQVTRPETDDTPLMSLERFYTSIFEEMKRKLIFPGAVKPNEGFFSRHDAYGNYHDFDASKILSELISDACNIGLPVIFDAKRGDIGPSSENYARELVDVWGADAITISPYMGTDSVEPFLKARAAYVLCRTSNKGGAELQNLQTISQADFDSAMNILREYFANRATFTGVPIEINEAYTRISTAKPLYLRVADKIIDWDAISPGNVGAVVGATNMNELEAIAKHFVASGKKIPLLIPGVGKQGGSAQEVVETLKRAEYDLSIVRINSSSDLNFAWEKEGKPDDYAGAAVRALKKLNDEIGYTHAA